MVVLGRRSSAGADRDKEHNYMEVRSSWWSFAGVMFVIVGIMNLFSGLVAITQTRYIERQINGELPITNNVKSWGWVELVVGILMILVAVGIFSGSNWARVVGIIAAGINMIFQFAYIQHYPWWGFTAIIINLLIIFGLAGSSERRQEV
jgi:uncharacterized membrane protein (DUF2068 family)